MIVHNGLIDVIRTNSELDFSGNPVVSNDVVCSIPARVRQISRNERYKSSSGSAYTEASYEVLLDGTHYGIDYINVYKCGKFLGKYAVISLDYLESVCATKIIC